MKDKKVVTGGDLNDSACEFGYTKGLLKGRKTTFKTLFSMVLARLGLPTAEMPWVLARLGLVGGSTSMFEM